MAVHLIKAGARVTLGYPLEVHPDRISCTLCGQSYDLLYSLGEKDRLAEWLPRAKVRIDISHGEGHPASLPLAWP